MRLFHVILPITLCSVTLSGQAQTTNTPLYEIYFPKEVVKQEGIKSVHVFAENVLERDNGSGNYIIAFKRSEGEFNDQGLISYRRHDNSELDFYQNAIGGETTSHERFTYDEAGRILELCQNHSNRNYCTINTYDEEGNLTESRFAGESIHADTVIFTWKKGKMVDFELKVQDIAFNRGHRSYDQQGRITEMEYGPDHRGVMFKTKYSYLEKDGLNSFELRNFHDDSLTNFTRTIRNDREQIVSSLHLDGQNDTISYFEATYDENHQISGLTYWSFSERRRKSKMMTPPPVMNGDGTLIEPKDEGSIPPQITIYSITNHYKNGLLVKREVTAADDKGVVNDEFNLREFFVYETEPLPEQSWPIEEEVDYRDY